MSTQISAKIQQARSLTNLTKSLMIQAGTAAIKFDTLVDQIRKVDPKAAQLLENQAEAATREAERLLDDREEAANRQS